MRESRRESGGESTGDVIYPNNDISNSKDGGPKHVFRALAPLIKERETSSLSFHYPSIPPALLSTSPSLHHPPKLLCYLLRRGLRWRIESLSDSVHFQCSVIYCICNI